MEESTIFLLGTSRQNGNTRNLVDAVNGEHNAPVLDLAQQKIALYDYEHRNKDDDFLRIITRLTECQNIVFATPVYWYAMSAQLKTFFDRLSDLVRDRKDLGRKLSGRRTFLLATGTEPEIPSGFEVPFRRSSEYLSMQYVRALYSYIQEDLVLPAKTKMEAPAFAREIFGKKS